MIWKNENLQTKHILHFFWKSRFQSLEEVKNLKRVMRDTRPSIAKELKDTIRPSCAFIRPQQCHRLVSMPHHAAAVIHAKEALTKY